jgi:hypothetical protein
MQPIVYEKHCRDCHPLRFSRRLALAGAADPTDHDYNLPHEKPEIVRGVMRERLIADYARRHAGAPLQSQPKLDSRLPNRKPPPSQQQWDWVEEELGGLETAFFRMPTSDGAAHPGNACLKCHESGLVAPNASAAFTIRPPGIPTRWMPHSRFRHDRHLNINCIECHQSRGGEAVAAGASSQANLLGSNTVQDILMPNMEKCQTCHGATSGSLAGFRPARKNCTECHAYHHVHRAEAAE